MPTTCLLAQIGENVDMLPLLNKTFRNQIIVAKTVQPLIKQASCSGVGKIGLAIANDDAVVAFSINGEHFLADDIMNGYLTTQRENKSITTVR
ncbi:hypothetical protein IDH36_16790 [Xenorhabdus griffiniae]|nr:hypothetical protein [Xenorhabdus griffiniae]MBD1229178.1 hypothetical protein [Xenorhabdus griffiniae]